MKRIISMLLSFALMFSFFTFNVIATTDEDFTPYIVDFNITTDITSTEALNENTRASDLIYFYGLSLSRTGTMLKITGSTHCVMGVVKCGFKDLMIQRRKTSSDSWKDYFEIGDVYAESVAANLDMDVSVASGYQYRVTCKHYAKKNLLTVETVSNISNIATTP